MDIELIKRNEDSPLNTDGWEKFESLLGKKIVITNCQHIDDLEDSIEGKEIFLMVVVYSMSKFNFFDVDNENNIVVPKWVNVKNYIILNDVELLERKRIYDIDLTKSLSSAMEILHTKPRIYFYSHSNHGRTRHMDYLTMINDMLNIDRMNKETETIVTKEKVVTVNIETNSPSINLNDYSPEVNIFNIKDIGADVDPSIMASGELPNLKKLKGFGRIENLKEFLKLCPNLESIDLVSEEYGNTRLNFN